MQNSHSVQDDEVTKMMSEKYLDSLLERDQASGKNDSKPYEISENKSEGRIVVATRDLKQGEVIFEELPLVRAPPFSTHPVCLGCYEPLERGNYFQCKICHWPFCNQSCYKSDNKDHKLECSLFEKQGVTVNPREFNFRGGPEPLYDVIKPLRVLGLNSKDLDVFMGLMSHLEEWKCREGFYESHKAAVNYILDELKLPNVTEEIILKIFAIGYTNTFESKFNLASAASKVQLTYPLTAMISHDCKPNVGRYIYGFDIDGRNRTRCLATRRIAKGEKLAITYVDILLPTLIRQKILLQSKNFRCQCNRCLNPTEEDCLICQKCSKGYIKPTNWNCDICKTSTMTEDEAETLTSEAHRKADALINNEENWHIPRYEEYLKRYGKKLHPSHLCLTRVKNSLACFYGRLQGYQMNDMAFNPNLLERKRQLCEECINAISNIEPGISSMKGVLMYEYHLPIFMKAQLQMQTGAIDPAKAKKAMKKAVKCLEASVENLKFNPPGSFEAQLCPAAQDGLNQLKLHVGHF